MASILVHGYRIKVDWYDSLINSFLFLWDCNETGVRKIPRNVWDHKFAIAYIATGTLLLPIAWLLSHIPFIWPESMAFFLFFICVIILIKPYADPFRALIGLLIGGLLLYFNVTFDWTIFGYHLEKYLYYCMIVTSIFALWRRFVNWTCWAQIDRICKKYNFPHYDQKTLMDNYEGIDTHYGEKLVTYDNYDDAMTKQQRFRKINDPSTEIENN